MISVRPVGALLLVSVGVLAILAGGAQPGRAEPGAIWYVAPVGSDGNGCALPSDPCATPAGAIAKASAGETVRVAVGRYTGAGGEVVLVNKSLTFEGGWNSAFTDRTGLSTIDGEHARRGVLILDNMIVRIERFVIENGVPGLSPAPGGGIASGGTLELDRSVVRANAGGGIVNFRTLLVTNSTISGNTSNQSSLGGGVTSSWQGNTPTTTIVDSTISGNTGPQGGGIYVGMPFGSATVTLKSVTVAGNSSPGGFGGGVDVESQTTLVIQNTIVAGNTANFGNDVFQQVGSTVVSQGYNIFTLYGNGSFTPGPGDKQFADPELGPLQANGGLTETRALLPGSPAIHAGDPAGCADGNGQPLAEDQRGAPRWLGAACDIGAFEYALGALDPSFGEGGRLTTDLGVDDSASAGVVLANGKIVVAGNTVGNAADFALARYLPDGSLDPVFGGTGTVTTNFGSFDSALGLAVQGDGKFVAAGLTLLGNDFALARYKRDGLLDPAFDGDGRVTTDFGGSDAAFDVVAQADGTILAAGGSSGDFALARYTVNGTLDSSFDGDGRVTTDFGATDGASALVVRTDGKIVVAGSSGGDFVLARYNENGSLDSTFGGDGRVAVDFGGTDSAADLVVLADGTIIVAGETQPSPPSLAAFALARLHADGSLYASGPSPLDAPFGVGGKVVTGFPGGPAGAAALAVEPTSGTVVAGGYVGSSSFGSFALARYRLDGALDVRFGLAGRLTTDFTPGADRAFDLAVQGDGAVVAIGTAALGSPAADFAISRYLMADCCGAGIGAGGG